MGEIGAQARAQAAKGIVPPRFNFAPVRADGQRVFIHRVGERLAAVIVAVLRLPPC